MARQIAVDAPDGQRSEVERCMAECVQREQELQGVGPQPGFAPRPVDREISALCAERCNFSNSPPQWLAQKPQMRRQSATSQGSNTILMIGLIAVLILAMLRG